MVTVLFPDKSSNPSVVTFSLMRVASTLLLSVASLVSLAVLVSVWFPRSTPGGSAPSLPVVLVSVNVTLTLIG